MSGERVVRIVTPAVLAGLIAFASGARAQDDRGGRRRPDRQRGLAGRRQGGPQGMMGVEPSAPMQVDDGKLYIVTGSTIRKLDAETLEEESTAVIPSPRDAERETKRKEKFMERFDEDGDGFVREDEVPNPAMIDKLDKDGDGAVSISEVPSPRAMRGPVSPVTLLVDGADLFVYRAGWLYRFDTADLTLEAQNEIAPRRPPDRERGRRDRFGGRGKKGKKGKRGKGDAPEPPPPPEPPADPVRF